MFDLDYYFAGHERIRLWFSNPNYAAAFFVILIPWLVAVRNAVRPRLGFALLALEVGLVLLAVKTYSRSALMAWVSAEIFLSFLTVSERRLKWGTLRPLALKLSICVLFAHVVGFSDRVAPDFVSSDRSVLNRFAMWQSAAQMLREAPLQGYGADYMQVYVSWFHPLALEETSPRTLSNTYLEVLCRFGIGGAMAIASFFGLIISSMVIAVRSSISFKPTARVAIVGAVGSLIAAGVAALFTQLIHVVEISSLVLVAIIALLLGFGLQFGTFKRMLSVTVVAGALGALGWFAAQALLRGPIDDRVVWKSPTQVNLQRRAHGLSAAILWHGVILDSREAAAITRRVWKANPTISRIDWLWHRSLPPERNPDVLVSIGQLDFTHHAPTIAIAPRGDAKISRPVTSRDLLILVENDPYGRNAYYRRIAREYKIRTEFSSIDIQTQSKDFWADKIGMCLSSRAGVVDPSDGNISN